MYQAAEEGEGGRDVGEGGGVEGRPSSQNSTETPLNPSKWVFFVFVSLRNWQGPNSYPGDFYLLPGCSTASPSAPSSLPSLGLSRFRQQ